MQHQLKPFDSFALPCQDTPQEPQHASQQPQGSLQEPPGHVQEPPGHVQEPKSSGSESKQLRSTPGKHAKKAQSNMLSFLTTPESVRAREPRGQDASGAAADEHQQAQEGDAFMGLPVLHPKSTCIAAGYCFRQCTATLSPRHDTSRSCAAAADEHQQTQEGDASTGQPVLHPSLTACMRSWELLGAIHNSVP